MKSEKLYDAITNISEENISRCDNAVKKMKKPSKKLWISWVAAMLVVAIVVGVVLWPGKDSIVISANAIFEAKYPMRDKDKLKGDKVDEGHTQNLNSFFEELMQKSLDGNGDENTVISPLSIYMALCVLAESTAGESQKQILDLLECKDIQELRKGANTIWNAVYNTHQSATRLLANSVWLDKSVEYNNVTMKNIADYYYASSFSGDIGSDAMNKVMQSWINENTKDILANQVKDIELSPESLYAILSTVYYKCSWEDRFKTDRTVQDTFHGAQGDTPAYFMKRSTYSWYYWGDGFAAAFLEIQGGDRMWIILPDEGTSPETLLNNSDVLSLLTPQKDTASNKHLRINMSIPRFDVEQKSEISGVLKEMGVTDVFEPYSADMTPVLKDGVLPYGDWLYASRVEHGVRVKVDERGVEGAAYTLIPADPGATEPSGEKVDFIVDRPFIFAVTDRNSLPIFAGIVNMP